uniref:GIY-YIG domain-containing protein n=1 Tax=Beauveria caledonica TaxID=38006 RepID=A0A192S1C6_9HYPO|nr:hypothetical protein [Beauveria caledonica]AMD61802.1 hypothetical protein [Beauveria caledonica]
MEIKNIYSYLNPYINRKQIYKDLRNQSGIYLWTNTITGKKYVGSSINLNIRLKNYFSKNYLEYKIQLDKSLIYRALLKYGYSNFKLEILEFCSIDSILEREQYYLDNLNLEYNLLKTARSLLGFKHSEYSKKLISQALLGRVVKEETKEKLSSNTQAFPVILLDLNNLFVSLYPSIRKVSDLIQINHTYVNKCLNKKGYCFIKYYFIIRNNNMN